MLEAAPRNPVAALSGVRVLVTRPRHQSDALVALIEARGGHVIRFPVIEILPAADADAARTAMETLDGCFLAIFTSANAVEHGLALLDDVPRGTRVAAVGARTAERLEQVGFEQVFCPPDGASSEALLVLDALAPEVVRGKRILVVRGDGGRDLLARVLTERGAEVRHAEVYQRARPRIDSTPVAREGRAGAIDVIVATSVEGLENLFRLLGESEAGWLENAGYVVLSERIAAHARTLGVRLPPVIAGRADDESVVDALIRWRSAGRGGPC